MMCGDRAFWMVEVTKSMDEKTERQTAERREVLAELRTLKTALHRCADRLRDAGGKDHEAGKKVFAGAMRLRMAIDDLAGLLSSEGAGRPAHASHGRPAHAFQDPEEDKELSGSADSSRRGRK